MLDARASQGLSAREKGKTIKDLRLTKESQAFLAQWLERVAVNHKVVGSIPTGGVICTLHTFISLCDFLCLSKV